VSPEGVRPADVVVAGLGAVGSASAAALARRGLHVIGLDPHEPPHRLGSSHGETRMIRQAYSEGAAYVPLVRRAYAAWRELEERSGRRLLVETGGLLAGAPDGALLQGASASAERHGLPLDRPGPDATTRDFPWLRVDPGHRVLVDPRAGHLRVEDCISALLAEARAAGADLRTGTSVVGWSSEGAALRVDTSSGPVRCAALLLAAGAWTASLREAPPLRLQPVRMVQHWFDAREADFDAKRLPVFLLEFEPERYLYGFPDVGTGVKAAFHHGGHPSHPDAVERTVAPGEIEEVRAALGRHFPGATWVPLRSEVCLYTLTPDRDFVVDRHPEDPRVVIAAGFSGHGFKFASALGEVTAELVTGREPGFDLSPFRLARFGTI